MSVESSMLYQISEKIRKLRNDQGITLKELSAKTGLSVSFLSQVERGSSSLAIPSLEKIAKALDISIAEFFISTNKSHYVTKKNERKEVHPVNSLSTLILFSGEFPGKKLEPLMVVLQPGQNDNIIYHHPGEEFYFVLEGEVVFTIQDREYHLQEGDTIHFPSDVPHTWKNPIGQYCRLLGVVTPVLF